MSCTVQAEDQDAREEAVFQLEVRRDDVERDHEDEIAQKLHTLDCGCVVMSMRRGRCQSGRMKWCGGSFGFNAAR